VYAIEEQSPFHPTYIRVPGYPLFVAAVYEVFGDWDNTAVRSVQAVLDTVTCGLVAWLAFLWAPADWSLDRRRRAAVTAFAAAAVCPFPLIYPATLLTETLALLLGTAAVGLATAATWELSLRRTRAVEGGRALGLWAGTGAIAGLAALVRPENGLYLAVAAAMLLATGLRRTWRTDGARVRAVAGIVVAGLALGLGFAAALAPWTIRNFRVFGIFQPLNPKTVAMPDEFVPIGYETWVRTWIDHPRYIGEVLFSLDADPIHTSQMPDSAFDSIAERARVDTLLGQYNAPAPDADPDPEGRWPPGGMKPALDEGFMQIARERIARHPVRYYVVLPGKRILALWFTTHADFYPFSGYLRPLAALDYDRAQQVWLPLFLGLLIAWTAAAWAGVGTIWRAKGGGDVLLLLTLLILPRLLLLSWLANPEPRYTVEFFPFVSALAGIWIANRAAEPAPE
jgi:hypothetical protein